MSDYSSDEFVIEFQILDKTKTVAADLIRRSEDFQNPDIQVETMIDQLDIPFTGLHPNLQAAVIVDEWNEQTNQQFIDLGWTGDFPAPIVIASEVYPLDYNAYRVDVRVSIDFLESL